MKLDKYFWGMLLVTLMLFVYPYYETRIPPPDANTVIGFPLTAYSFGGGMCALQPNSPIDDPGIGKCPSSWFPLNIFVDVLFIFGLPMLISQIIRRVSLKKLSKK